MSKLFTTISLYQDFNNAFTSLWQQNSTAVTSSPRRAREDLRRCLRCLTTQSFILRPLKLVENLFFFFPKLRILRFELIIHVDSIIVSMKGSVEI